MLRGPLPLFLDGGRGLLTHDRPAPQGHPEALAWRDAGTGAVLRSVPLSIEINPAYRGEPVDMTAVSPDGKYFVLGGRNGAQIWEVATARAVSPLLRSREMHFMASAAFSPDGRTLLTGASDGTVQRWSVPSGQALGRPTAHPTY